MASIVRIVRARLSSVSYGNAIRYSPRELFGNLELRNGRNLYSSGTLKPSSSTLSSPVSPKNSSGDTFSSPTKTTPFPQLLSVPRSNGVQFKINGSTTGNTRNSTQLSSSLSVQFFKRNLSTSKENMFLSAVKLLQEGTEAVGKSFGGGMWKLVLIAAGVIIVVYYFGPITVVPAGHVGVVDVFGKVKDKILPPGIHLVNPFAKVVKMSVKTQVDTTTCEVPSKEGLPIELEVAVLFRLDPEKAVSIYNTVGDSYAAVVLQPQFKSAIRQITAGYDAKGLYTADTRAQMTSELHQEVSRMVIGRGIIIEETPLKALMLPKRLTTAIEEKLKAEQDSQRMEFVLDKERLEAKRKEIEATGISNFQKIVSEGVSEQLLRWKGIEATEKLADSQNSKVIIIGGKDGLPLILNTSQELKLNLPTMKELENQFGSPGRHL